MDERAKRIRQEATRCARGALGRRRYPSAIRCEAAMYFREQQGRGVKQRWISEQLGIPVKTLKYWAREDGCGLRPVEVVSELSSIDAGKDGVGLRLVTPRGCRVEGLTEAQLVSLLKVLG